MPLLPWHLQLLDQWHSLFRVLLNTVKIKPTVSRPPPGSALAFGLQCRLQMNHRNPGRLPSPACQGDSWMLFKWFDPSPYFLISRVTRPACHFNPGLGPSCQACQPTGRPPAKHIRLGASYARPHPAWPSPLWCSSLALTPLCFLRKVRQIVKSKKLIIWLKLSVVQPLKCWLHLFRLLHTASVVAWSFVTRLKIRGAPGSSSDWGSTQCAPTKTPALWRGWAATKAKMPGLSSAAEASQNIVISTSASWQKPPSLLWAKFVHLLKS